MADQGLSDRAIELLERIAVGIEGLRADLAVRSLPRDPPADDRAVLALVPLIAQFSGGRQFSTAELVRHAALPAAVVLRAAIRSAVGDGNQAQRLGLAFRRIEGRLIGDLVVRRIDKDRNGAVWEIARVRESLPHIVTPRKGR